MGRYASRPDFVDKNFSQDDPELAVEAQARAYNEAKKQKELKEKEAADYKSALEKEKIYRDQAEQRIKELEEKASKSDEPAAGQEYNPYAGYQTVEDQQREIARKVLEEERAKEQKAQFEKLAKDNINNLKTTLGIDKYRERESHLTKIADRYQLWNSPFAPQLANDIYEKEKAEEAKRLEKEAEDAKKAKMSGSGETGGAAGMGAGGSDDKAIYGGKTAAEVVQELLPNRKII